MTRLRAAIDGPQRLIMRVRETRDGRPRSVADLELPLMVLLAILVGIGIVVWLNGQSTGGDEIRRVTERPQLSNPREALAAGAARRARVARARVHRARVARRRLARSRAAAAALAQRSFSRNGTDQRNGTSYGNSTRSYSDTRTQTQTYTQQTQPRTPAPKSKSSPAPKRRSPAGGGGFDDSG